MESQDSKPPIFEEDEDERFYQELDERSSHKSCCTFQTLLILFFGILIIISGIIFYFYWQITREKKFPTSLSTSANLKEVTGKIEDIQFDANQQFTLKISDQDLTTLFLEGISAENFVLNDIQVSTNPANMLIYGTLMKPLNSKVVMTVVPQAQDGKVKFEIKSISAGNINLPQILTNKVSNSLSENFSQKFALLYQKGKVEEINLKEGYLEIIGSRK